MSRGTTVLKNSAFLLAAEPFKRVLSLVTFALIGRHLSVEHLGIFYLGGAVMAIMGVFVSFGTNAYLTREIAKDRERAGRLSGEVFLARTVTYLAGMVVTYVFAIAMGYDPLPFQVILIVAAGMLFVQWEDVCVCCFDGFQRMEYAAVASVIKTAAILAAAVIAVTADWDVRALAAVYNAAYLVGFLASYWFVRRHLTRFEFRLRMEPVLRTLRAGWPFLTINALWIIAFRVDTVMLSAIPSVLDKSVGTGLYAAAYRLFEVLVTLPILFGRALFPAFSEQVGLADREGMSRLYGRALHTFAVIGLPICVGVALLGRPFVVAFVGEKYADAGPALSLFGAMLWMWFVSTTAGWALTALNRLRFIFWMNLFSTAVNVAANLALIPRYSFVGAAVATGISEVVLLASYSIRIHRELGVLTWRLFPARPLLASAAMGGAIYAILVATPAWSALAQISAVVPAAAVVYFGVLWAVGGFGETERALAEKFVSRLRRKK